jgi:hypothetical protein
MLLIDCQSSAASVSGGHCNWEFHKQKKNMPGSMFFSIVSNYYIFRLNNLYVNGIQTFFALLNFKLNFVVLTNFVN